MLGRLGARSYKQVLAHKAKIEKQINVGLDTGHVATFTPRQQKLYQADLKRVEHHEQVLSDRASKMATQKATSDAAYQQRQQQAQDEIAAHDAQVAALAKQKADQQAAQDAANQQAAADANSIAAGGGAAVPSWASGGGSGGGSSFAPSGAFPGDIASFAPSDSGGSAPGAQTADGGGVSKTTILVGVAALAAAFVFLRKKKRR